MTAHGSYFWKKAPFIKLLTGLITGIILQWYLGMNINFWLIVLLISLLTLSGFFFIPFFKRFKFLFISGMVVFFIFLSFGALLAWRQDIRNKPDWLGNYYKEKDALVVTLEEPPAEKLKTFKANATAGYILKNNSCIPVSGRIIVYFKKDSSFIQEGLMKPVPGYGSIIIFKNPLREIKNAGNPGGFDYRGYALFHGMTHQVFLKQDEYEVLEGKASNQFKNLLFSIREKVLGILRQNIPGRKESGLAEALLIGYKDHLDQDLVQAYTNTGVVHIIAVSGLHLGLIYWLLVQLCRPFQKIKKFKWLRPILIISGLWLFSLLAGAQPSVLRSALMFTCLVLGEGLGRRSSVFNTLAFSAFILLCINPFWLWDVGFQLSYAAVLSIIIFMRPVYNWFYIQNKILDFIWKMNAVTLSAQVLTVPLSIYHFHQFPNFFLLTNFVAVPLSSIILIGEICLCAVAWFPALALPAGKLIHGMIWLMNNWIEGIEALRFSLWDHLQIGIVQALLLLAFIAGIGYWLMEKEKSGLLIGLFSLLGFAFIRSFSFIRAGRQQKIIVYNVPQRRAIDFVEGRKYFFMGDSGLLADDFARNFHLKPSRILYRIKPAGPLKNFHQNDIYFQFADKKIMLLDSSIRIQPTENKPVIDLLVISKNPKVYIAKLTDAINIKQVVFDGSVPAWKTVYWKKDCDSLHIPWHDTTMKGAFEMKLN